MKMHVKNERHRQNRLLFWVQCGYTKIAQRIFKHSDTQYTSLTPNKILNSFIYRTLFYVNIYGSYKLSKNSPVIWPTLYLELSMGWVNLPVGLGSVGSWVQIFTMVWVGSGWVKEIGLTDNSLTLSYDFTIATLIIHSTCTHFKFYVISCLSYKLRWHRKLAEINSLCELDLWPSALGVKRLYRSACSVLLQSLNYDLLFKLIAPFLSPLCRLVLTWTLTFWPQIPSIS